MNHLTENINQKFNKKKLKNNQMLKRKVKFSIKRRIIKKSNLMMKDSKNNNKKNNSDNDLIFNGNHLN